MMPTKVPTFKAKPWPHVTCATCKMVFTISPLDEPSGVRAKFLLRQELDRHFQLSHIDLPSDWNPRYA